ncbi:hypothetical protein M011DRAFT_488218 [Sporormia fimetaria CBS 119925]|uniref:DNA-binding protein RAP1 n=1 Tax=Sporormia fimetaria CBS 119925 TaxID=1340428 RepID=A0A6A6V3W5_9PLEO|nr:hypothetical protein M011DRAFT_488218 [Sporormia fimetaria CBS 119925]
MASTTVYEDFAEGASDGGDLFAGKKFFLIQRCPSREHFRKLIESNGGQVIKLEKLADYVIGDHVKAQMSPPGSISYTFIEDSIKNGALADPEQHPAGPRNNVAREAGSRARPTKAGRTPYTAKDDYTLYRWVEFHKRHNRAVSGNEIYKQLEAKHPRHTWQSYRDRYLKTLINRPPPPKPANYDNDPVSSDSPSPPPTKRSSTSGDSRPHKVARTSAPTNGHSSPAPATKFTKEDWEELYAIAEDIRNCPPSEVRSTWEDFAAMTEHSADEWIDFFENDVYPQWEKDSHAKREAINQKVEERRAKKELEEANDAEDRSEEEDDIQEEPDTSISQNGKPQMSPSPSRVALQKMAGKEHAEVPEHTQSSVGTEKSSEKADDLWSSTLKPSYLGLSHEALLERLLVDHKGRAAHEGHFFWVRCMDAEKKAKLYLESPSANAVEVYRTLKERYVSLPKAEKYQYELMAFVDQQRWEMEMEQARSVRSEGRSSTTVMQKTPEYIERTHKSIMSQIKEGQLDDLKGPPAKRQKLTKPSNKLFEPDAQAGTEEKPLGISSGDESSEYSEDTEKQEQQAQTQIMEEADELNPQLPSREDDGETPTARRDASPPAHRSQIRGSSPLPPDTPKPKKSTFDTQAILDSESQLDLLQPIPRPPASPPAQEPFSPLRPPSEASTTESLQEFRHSVQSAEPPEPSIHTETFDDDSQTLLPPASPPPPMPHPAVQPDSDPDPDGPLCDEEVDDFVAEQKKRGVTEDQIYDAMARTYGRPLLTARVLTSVLEKKPLPEQRGIWTFQDDEDLRGGVHLDRVIKKHTLDGWGGVMERRELFAEANEKSKKGE